MKLKKIIERLSPELRSVLNLMAIQGFFWFSWALGSYQTVYLQSNGMTSSQIGILNAVASIVAIFAMTFWGLISDKINSIKRTFIIVLVVGMSMYSLFPLIPANLSFSVIIFIVYASLVNFSRCAAPTLLDNLTIRNCTEQHLNYGIIRSFGSFTFAVGSMTMVALAPIVGVGSSFWMSAVMIIPCIIAILFARDPKVVHTDNKEKVKINPKELFSNYYYIILLIFAAICYVAISGESSFLTYLMADKNIPIENLGSVLGTRALMEIIPLLLIMKLRRRVKLKYLIMTACSLMGLEAALLGMGVHSYPQLILTVTIYGMGNGIFIGSIPIYIYKLAPNHLKASAQTVFASVSSVSGIIGNFCGGFIYEKVGGGHFYMLMSAVFFTAVIFFMIFNGIRKNLHNPADVKD